MLLLVLVCSWSALAETTAILPFANVSKNPTLDWVGESIAESLREAFASEGLLVAERDARVDAYKKLGVRGNGLIARATVLKIGETMDAEKVVFGRFEVLQAPGAKPSVKIVARVADLAKTRQSAEFSELGALDDLMTLQNHLAWQAWKFIVAGSAVAEEEFLRRRPAIRLDALENYVRGLMAANSDQKHRYFTQAARIDPKFSPPLFQLGKLQFEKEAYRVAADWLAKVAESDAHHREAKFLLGLSRYYSLDFTGAEIAFRIVARAVPVNEVLNNLGAALLRQGQFDAALEQFEKAREGDGADPDYHFNIGYAKWRRGDYEAAAERFRAVLERDSSDEDATLLLGKCLKKMAPRAVDGRTEGLERIKEEYEESAYWQLKSMLEKTGGEKK